MVFFYFIVFGGVFFFRSIHVSSSKYFAQDVQVSFLDCLSNLPSMHQITVVDNSVPPAPCSMFQGSQQKGATAEVVSLREKQNLCSVLLDS